MKTIAILVQIAAVIFAPILGAVILDANQRHTVLSLFDSPSTFSFFLFFSVGAIIISYHLGNWIGYRRISAEILNRGKEIIPTSISEKTIEISSTVEQVERYRRKLRTLTANEKSLLTRHFTKPDSKSSVLPNEDDTVRSLSRASVIHVVNARSTHNQNAEYWIAEWAWQILKMEPYLLQPESHRQKSPNNRPFKRNNHLDGLDNF
ncbi:MAG: superinfection exclusion B family protein [Bacteroidia bacterium]|nr:superinfection exclusion B family protein [Bacteroidia bacterium]